MKLAYTVLVFLSIGCIGTGVRHHGPTVSTILVKNETGLAVTLSASQYKLGTVVGREECLVIGQSVLELLGSPQTIVFRVTSEDPYRSHLIDLYRSQTITIGPWPNSRWRDMLTLRPAPRCDGGMDGSAEKIFRPRDQPRK